MSNVITVSALNRYVKQLLESDAVLTDIALRGEITNFVHHKSGHFYFSLRDEQCSVKAVMFRGNASQLAFEPQNGMRVIVQCRISLFERDGAFQVYAEHLVPDGVGAMQLAFDQLKAKLEKEGLFDEAHKKPLPAEPKCVGLVTSKTGAAIQDIFNVTRRRWPAAHFLLAPVIVQGNEAADQIADAIRALDVSGRVDVIIVARGGGSKEDLWVFNDEKIARAAYACQTPLVSAVGHEIDFSILDFVADLRAPTPSAAAELVMPDSQHKVKEICILCTNIRKEMQKRFVMCYNENNRYVQQIPAAVSARLQAAQKQLRYSAALCASLNPMQVLARGYGIVRKHGAVIQSAAQAKQDEQISVQLQDGVLYCKVLQTEKAVQS